MEDKEDLAFALLLDIDEYGYVNVEVKNVGIPKRDLILYLETWLEHVKGNIQDRIRDDLTRS